MKIDLSKFPAGKYKVVARLNKTTPSEEKLYCIQSQVYIPDAGDIIHVNKSEFRQYKEDQRRGMLDVDGTRCGSYDCTTRYLEIVPFTETEEKEMTLEKHYMAMQDNCGIKTGDRVKILRTAKSREMGWRTQWSPRMDDTVGDEEVVKLICSDGIKLSNSWYYPFFVLQKLEKSPTKLTVDSNEVIITDESLKFGCTTLDKNDVELLIKSWNEHKVKK